MNIKQASEVSGVSSRNIRYYEQAGLICRPAIPETDTGSIPKSWSAPSN